MMRTRAMNRIAPLMCGAVFLGGRTDVWRPVASAAAPPPEFTPCLLSSKSGFQEHFNQQIYLKGAASFLENCSDHIHEAARKDCEERNCSLQSYLLEWRREAVSFIKSNQIWDRESLKHHFEHVLSGSDVNDNGKIVFFSGGQSFGKTVLLNSLNLPEGSKNGAILRLDGRGTGSDFQSALSNAVANCLGRPVADVLFDEASLEDDWEALKASGSPTIAASVDMARKLLDAYIKTYDIHPNNETNPIVRMERALTVLAKHHPPLTIIIDQAKVYFKEAKGDRAKEEILALIVKLTKQEKKLNVIFVTADNSFPNQLRALGFNMADLQTQYIIGDLTPKATYELLTEQWHVGPNLAVALINLFGGHLYAIKGALDDFYIHKETYKPYISYGLESDVKLCLEECLSSEDEFTKKYILLALCTLAQTGFLKMQCGLTKIVDPVDMSIIKHNVGGFVSRQAFAPSIPNELRNNEDGIAPSSQMMRMAIISVIYAISKDML